MDNTYKKYETAWCPGCGNFSILNSLKEALEQLEIPPYQVLVVGGIGQAAKTPQYLNTNGFAGLHGRALPVAVAAKIANSKLKVVVNTGDGDSYGEGGNHFIHNIRRNVDITHFVHDNQIYGLTKGQASPTSDLGHVTDFTPKGVTNKPLNPLLVALSLGAGFVARAYAGQKEHLVKIMKEAIKYEGYALVDILQPCISFNKLNTYKWYNDRVYILDDTYDYTNKVNAMEKSQEWGDSIPLGTIYKEPQKTYLDHYKFAQETPLVDLENDKDLLNEYIHKFI
jgi:2-oxoglutarate ferredoxin oxidoreductase subunit beta